MLQKSLKWIRFHPLRICPLLLKNLGPKLSHFSKLPKIGENSMLRAGDDRPVSSWTITGDDRTVVTVRFPAGIQPALTVRSRPEGYRT